MSSVWRVSKTDSGWALCRLHEQFVNQLVRGEGTNAKARERARGREEEIARREGQDVGRGFPAT